MKPLFVILAILAVGTLVMLGSNTRRSESGNASRKASSLYPDTEALQHAPNLYELQAGRERLMQQMIDEAYFLKIEKLAQHPHVYVTWKFQAANIDDKNMFLNIVWAYYGAKDPKAHSVLLFDARTGKKIGVYSEVYNGLKLD